MQHKIAEGKGISSSTKYLPGKMDLDDMPEEDLSEDLLSTWYFYTLSSITP